MSGWDFLKEAAARNVLFVIAVVIMAGLAFYAVRRLRDSIVKDDSSDSDLLSKYREMHERGDISDQEYRTIKDRLRTRLQQDRHP